MQTAHFVLLANTRCVYFFAYQRQLRYFAHCKIYCENNFTMIFQCKLLSPRQKEMHFVQSYPVKWPILIIFGALPWPNEWVCQQRVVIWLWVDALSYNISKNQLPRSKTVASSPKKVHFWNPIWGTPSALWNGPSPRTRLFLNQSG